MSDTQQKIIEFIKDVANQTPEKPDHWSSCGQCSNNSGNAEDLLELIEKEALPTDTEMLDWMISKEAVIEISHGNFVFSNFQPDTREDIAAEMAKEIK